MMYCLFLLFSHYLLLFAIFSLSYQSRSAGYFDTRSSDLCEYSIRKTGRLKPGAEPNQVSSSAKAKGRYPSTGPMLTASFL
jgi:hypothetical protein